MLIRRPWIGSSFSGLLLIGESHYGAMAEVDDAELTRHLVKQYSEGRWRHRFFTRVAKLIEGEDGLDPRSFWQRVAFFNFCPGRIDDPGRRPSAAMWEAGHAAVPRLLHEIRPQHMLVLGAETWENMPPFDGASAPITHEGRSREVGYYRVGDGQLAPATSVPHPTGSRSFSPTHWHPFVTEFLELPPRSEH